MLLPILFITYAALLGIWLIASLIVIFYLLRYQSLSLSAWLVIAIYVLLSANILYWSWHVALPLIDFDFGFSFDSF